MRVKSCLQVLNVHVRNHNASSYTVNALQMGGFAEKSAGALAVATLKRGKVMGQ
jgi:hypothetical protein